MIILGVVGGIGSGKSYVAEILAREHGAVAIHADRLAHDALGEPAVIDELTARFGPEILDADGRIVRAALARLVFGEEVRKVESRKFLESVIHPRVREEIRRLLDATRAEGAEIVVLDVPLLYESGWDRECDAVVFVDASEATRLRRTADRGWDAQTLRLREASQLPVAEKKNRADWTLRNEGDSLSMQRQAADLINKLRGHKSP